jgi:hypothetical protein
VLRIIIGYTFFDKDFIRFNRVISSGTDEVGLLYLPPFLINQSVFVRLQYASSVLYFCYWIFYVQWSPTKIIPRVPPPGYTLYTFVKSKPSSSTTAIISDRGSTVYVFIQSSTTNSSISELNPHSLNF